MTNTILWGNTPEQVVYYNTSWVYRGDYLNCNIQGQSLGSSSNIDELPVFVDVASGDYRLSANSPCIDIGDDSVAPPADYEGTLRWDEPGVGNTLTDLGAYEYHP